MPGSTQSNAPVTEPTEPAAPQSPASQAPAAPASQASEHMIPKSRLDEVLDSNRKLKEALDQLNKDKEKREQDALREQGKFEDLYKQSQARVTELEGKVGTLEQYETTLKEIRDQQLKSIPDAFKSLVPSTLSVIDQLKWISTNQKLLAKPQPFDIGEGRRGAQGEDLPAAPELTEEELRVAKSFGMSAEEYNKFK